MSFRFGHYIPGAAAPVACDAGPLGPPPEIVISAGDDGTTADGFVVPGALADGFSVSEAVSDGFTVELSGFVGAIVAEVWLSEFATAPGPADVVASGTFGALPGP